jgi:tetratricopeptide (TPR) repeat protein
LLAQQPDATFLNFALGNQYAVQGRWEDAQSAYFRAFSADPEHPDYAYNLAVSLDHLRQPRLALEYYQRALALAGKRAVGFNSAQVEARIRELTR